MTTAALAAHLDVPPSLVEGIVTGVEPLTATLALRLAAAFGTTPEFWLNAQRATDLFLARREMRALPEPLLRAG